MKKFGFTLAEALITLGIIGVIAAITMPMVTQDAHNQANAAKLASTVADLESAFNKMILDENAEDIESKVLKIFKEYIEKWADKYYC